MLDESTELKIVIRFANFLKSKNKDEDTVRKEERIRNDLRIRHDWNKFLAEMDGHVLGFSPERRVNDAGNGDWHGPEKREGWPGRPERIAVICKEVKGMGKSGRRTEREFESREREREEKWRPSCLRSKLNRSDGRSVLSEIWTGDYIIEIMCN